MSPLRGTIKAYEIRDVSQLAPGLLADGFLGDLVLENDLVRAVVRRPDPSLPSMPPAGALIDLSNQKSRADYLNYYEPLPDVETTTTRIKIERVVSFLVDKQTTARLVLSGKLVAIRTETPPHTDDEAEAPVSRPVDLPVKVTHTYELARDLPYLVLRTQFTNESTSPVELFPGDYIDWGEAKSFVEGYGLGNGAQTKAQWVGAFIDDFSAGVCLPGNKLVTNLSAGRYTVVQAFDAPTSKQGILPSPSLSSGAKNMSPTSAAGVEAAPVPQTVIAPMVAPSAAPPRTETHYVPTESKPKFTPIPAETNYSPRVMLSPAGRTGSVELASMKLLSSTDEDLPLEFPGGGSKRNELVSSTPAVSATLAKQGIALPREESVPQKPVVLPPGKSYEFVRFVVVGDRNLSRVSEQIYRLKGIPLGVIAGLVFEEGSQKPIPYAEVRLSGGPSWQAGNAPYAFTRTLTKADGTFVARVPYGNYLVTATKVGRELVSQPQKVSVFQKSTDQYVGLALSKESRLEVAVSDPEAATSAPLPSRLVLLAKPGTEPVDWGYGPGSVAGVRNIAYMPYGAASLPVSPGYYRLYVSRGPEYDAIEQDVVITRGSTQKVIVTLPRAFSTPGMLSADLGVLTTASAVSLVSPTDLAVMAACEGVAVLVTGDYERVTDLSAEIKRLGLQRYVKCIPGVRFLVSGRGATANVLVYPVPSDLAEKLLAFRAKHQGTPPDVFLADLRKEFPQLVVQIDQPLHPLAGYLAPFPFDDRFKRYNENEVPPPDFHALQILNGKIVAEFQDVLDRYFDLAIKRTRSYDSAPALTPLGSSMCRLPYGTEIGCPRVYVITVHDTLDTFTPTDLANSILNQRVVVTNGPLPKLLGYSPAARTYAAQPGDVVDTGTTGALPMKINILASSWISLSNFDLTWNGKMVRRVQVMPVKRVLRYPVRQQKDADIQHIYVDGDGFTNLICFSNRQSLTPIVPPAPTDFGGDVWPLAWTGPIYVDQDRNGKIRVEDEREKNEQRAKPTTGP
ncbi:MAG: carboxypeptidase-like regulatory domain-containing protein [Candidatus Sumerlaeaceae bacterium]|nr:carboxypeptidase-like regulatory domain-containing protein [Candidatus Sumerlaeaceae bacterium]